MPSFPGMEKFKDRMLHSHDYKDYHGFEDKRVVIVGIGNSGGDIAVELSRISSQVYLSTRRGSWIFNRVMTRGRPLDMVLSVRFTSLLKRLFPFFAAKLVRVALNQRFNHALFSLEPSHEPTSSHPTINDDLPNKIASGAVKIKADIKEITENSVEFVDGTIEENIDAIIFATGYIFGFPFLDENVIKVVDNQVDLYKYMLPPNLEKQTMAVIGCFQPLGAIMSISEMQCRLATRIFKGVARLPPKIEMWDDIRTKQEVMKKVYVKSTRHTLQVEYVDFMDELGELVGCKPDFVKLLLSDPRLALKYFFDATTPYQYRLMGPGAWPGAREAIMTQWERTNYPLKSMPLGHQRNTNVWPLLMLSSSSLHSCGVLLSDRHLHVNMHN